MPTLNAPNMSAPFWQVSCEATFLQERIWLAVPSPTWRRVRSSSPQHHESDIFQASDKRSGKDYSIRATLVPQQSHNRQGSSKSVHELRPKQADSKPPATLPSWVIFAIQDTRDPSRVLEFVLERGAFYSPFATATISYEKPVFPFVKRPPFETASDVL